MESALVTGITGQDGGYLAEQLAREGLLIHGLVRPDEAAPEHLLALGDRVTLHEAALEDESSLRDIMKQAQPDLVFNLVGLSSVAQSWAEPVLTAQVNGVFVARLLELVLQHQERAGKPVRLVQASSAEIFAGAETFPQDEQTALSPMSPYGASKAFAHHLVQVFRLRGLHASNAVLYNHESPRRPPSFVTRKITSTAAAIARGDASELVLGSLDARRDWGWAPEYVDAMVRMARHDDADDYVVATGTSHSVQDFVATAFRHAGLEEWRRYVRTDAAFVRPVDAVELRGNALRAQEALGWVPSVSFDELVRRMIDAEA